MMTTLPIGASCASQGDSRQSQQDIHKVTLTAVWLIIGVLTYECRPLKARE